MTGNGHEQFVCSAAQKKKVNLRKRKPDLRMTAVLECALRRVSSEMLTECEYVHKAKRSKWDEDTEVSVEVQFDEFASRWEELQARSDCTDSSTDQNSQENFYIRAAGPVGTHDSVAPNSVDPKNEFHSHLDFEAFMQSLSEASSTEIGDLDDLLREMDFGVGSTLTTQSCREEVEDFIDNFDPFFPGTLDVLCS